MPSGCASGSLAFLLHFQEDVLELGLQTLVGPHDQLVVEELEVCEVEAGEVAPVVGRELAGRLTACRTRRHFLLKARRRTLENCLLVGVGRVPSSHVSEY